MDNEQDIVISQSMEANVLGNEEVLQWSLNQEEIEAMRELIKEGLSVYTDDEAIGGMGYRLLSVLNSEQYDTKSVDIAYSISKTLDKAFQHMADDDIIPF